MNLHRLAASLAIAMTLSYSPIGLAGKETYFVAVGSLHLVGPRGLIQVLQSRGYEVKQK